MRRFLGLTALLAAATPALAQSLNIDINRNFAGYTAPSNAYGAAAGQTGAWNMVNGGSSGTQTLVGLNGASSGCTITKDGSTGSSTSTPGTGDWASLIEDFDYSFGIQTSVEYSINGLDEGTYIVYVYACSLGDSAFWIDNGGFENYYYNYLSLYIGANVSAAASSSTTGLVTPNVLEEGITHRAMVVNIPAGAPALRVRSSCGATNHERSALNGIQLVKVDTNRLYVNKNTATPGAGTGWASALKEVRSALSFANASNGAINEIWVAAGEYYPAATAIRSASFVIPSDVQLYGGFDGAETLLSQRDVDANITTLSGDPAQTATLGDNCYHVIESTNGNSTTRIDGFSIREGQATGVAVEDKDGAALYLDASNIKVFNCKFDICQAESEGAHAFLTNNSAPAFVNCSFYNGYAVQYGGAIRNTTDSRFSATNCFFGFCGAGFNGGAINSTSEAVGLYNCVFSDNFCGSNGGAVYIFGTGATANVVNCSFGYNSAGDFDTTGSFGGLGSASTAEVNVRNCIFFNNDDNNAATSLEAGNLGETSGGILTPDYCLVQGWNGGLGGVGSFNAVPLWTDVNGADNILGTPDDDYSLLGTSPGLDAGRTTSLPTDVYDLDGDLQTVTEYIPFDIAGNARIVDLTNVANGAVGVVDLGAFERPNLQPGDMNCNGAVDFFDIDPFLLALFDPAGYAAQFPNCNALNGDMQGDGLLNFFDIDPFVACLFGACP